MAADTAEVVNLKTLTQTPFESWEMGVEQDGMAGMRFRREEDGTFSCAKCGWRAEAGKGPNSVQAHWNMQCPEHPEHLVRKQKQADARDEPKVGPVPRSRRGLKRQGLSRPPTVLEEIRDRPGGMTGGPPAYFIRPDGATIREALIIYPNGAPVLKNGTDRANARYYQDRLRDKGYEYIGPTLTTDGVKRLVQVIKGNQSDYVLDLKEQIQEAEYTIANSDRPEVRDNARKRRGQLERLLELARREIDPEAIVKELDDILKAMRLAALSPAQREAITIMMGSEIDSKLQGLIGRLEKKGVSGDFAEGSFSATTRNAGPNEDF